MRWTAALSAVALVMGGLGGCAIALLRVLPSRAARGSAAAYIELFNVKPVVLEFLVAYFGIGVFGINVDAWTAATLALSLHSSAFLGEIWRGSIEAVPREQWEAARALSLPWLATLRLVVLPQALRTAIAPTVGFLVQLDQGDPR